MQINYSSEQEAALSPVVTAGPPSAIASHVGSDVDAMSEAAKMMSQNPGMKFFPKNLLAVNASLYEFSMIMVFRDG